MSFKSILFIALILGSLGGVWLAHSLADDTGYVLIAFGGYTVESTVPVLIFVAVALYLLISLIFYFMRNIFSSAHAIGRWAGARKITSARKKTMRGMVALAEGHWQTAERQMLSVAEDSEAPVLNYLVAAQAAQEQGAYERRDSYLQLAYSTDEDAKVAVGLTKANLLIKDEKLEDALACVTAIYKDNPRHPHVLKLYGELLYQLGKWEALYSALPQIRKRKVMDEKCFLTMEQDIYCHLLTQRALVDEQEQGSSAGMNALWNRAPERIHYSVKCVGHFVSLLIQQKRYDEAETLLLKAINRQWEPALIELYGQLPCAEPKSQLTRAEGWLTEYGENASLLYALGEICMRSQLWGKARDYYEQAARLRKDRKSYQAWANIVERLGDKEKAYQIYKEGLLLPH